MKRLLSWLTLIPLFAIVLALVPGESVASSSFTSTQSKHYDKLTSIGFSPDDAKAIVEMPSLDMVTIRAIQAKLPVNPKHKTGAKPTPKQFLDVMPKRNAKNHAAPPAAYLVLPTTLSYWLNDEDGDCVTAEEAFNKACDGILIADSTVQTWASQYGFLNGADLPTVMQQMASSGFKQNGNTYNDGPFVTVDLTQWSEVASAASAGRIKIGVASSQEQNVVGQTNGWFALDFQPDPNEDHCNAICGQGSLQQLSTWLNVTPPVGKDPNMQCVAVFTWKTVGIMSFTSMNNISQEGYLRTTSTITIGTGTPTPDKVTVFSGQTPPSPGPTPVPTPIPTPTPTPAPTPTPCVPYFHLFGTPHFRCDAQLTNRQMRQLIRHAK